VDENNLEYIGNKPSKDFYESIADLEYENFKDKNWNLKKETLDYLKSDTEGLLEVLTNFSNYIYNKYSLNITKFKTLPGLKYNPKYANLINLVDQQLRENNITLRDHRKLYEIIIVEAAKKMSPD
jgi:hypothetical protein